jgi:hypothetical protein
MNETNTSISRAPADDELTDEELTDEELIHVYDDGTVALDYESGPLPVLWLSANEARELAAALTEAADEA